MLIFNGCMFPNHCHCLLEDAFNTAQHIRKTLQHAANTLSDAFKTLSKGVVEAYRSKARFVKDALAKSQFRLLRTRFNTIQRCFRTAQIRLQTLVRHAATPWRQLLHEAPTLWRHHFRYATKPWRPPLTNTSVIGVLAAFPILGIRGYLQNTCCRNTLHHQASRNRNMRWPPYM